MQEAGFPEDALRQLEAQRLSPDRILNDIDDVAEIGALVRNTRAAPFLVRACRSLPAVSLECSLKPITRSVLRVSLTLSPIYDWAARIHGLGPEPGGSGSRTPPRRASTTASWPCSPSTGGAKARCYRAQLHDGRARSPAAPVLRPRYIR